MDLRTVLFLITRQNGITQCNEEPRSSGVVSTCCSTRVLGMTYGIASCCLGHVLILILMLYYECCVGTPNSKLYTSASNHHAVCKRKFIYVRLRIRLEKPCRTQQTLQSKPPRGWRLRADPSKPFDALCKQTKPFTSTEHVSFLGAHANNLNNKTYGSRDGGADLACRMTEARATRHPLNFILLPLVRRVCCRCISCQSPLAKRPVPA